MRRAEALERITSAIESRGYEKVRPNLRRHGVWLWFLDATMVDPTKPPYKTTDGYSRTYSTSHEAVLLHRLVREIEATYFDDIGAPDNS